MSTLPKYELATKFKAPTTRGNWMKLFRAAQYITYRSGKTLYEVQYRHANHLTIRSEAGTLKTITEWNYRDFHPYEVR